MQLLDQKLQSDIQIQISYLQIYCENITDLLADSEHIGGIDEAGGGYGRTATHKLSIREKKGGNVYVEGLRRYNVTTVADFTTLLERGDQARSTACTNMNETSSRSHAALLVHIIKKVSKMDLGENKDSSTPVENQGEDDSGRRESTLVLVDLAGSERASASEGKDYMRLEEAKAINLSLSALGNCMSALAEGKNRTHIPYRDSKLTRLLQFSLGGSSRTAIIVNIPPGEDPGMETLNALRFASRALKVKVAAKLNKVTVQRDYEALYVAACKKIDEIENLKNDESEVEELKRMLREKDLKMSQQTAEIESLRGKLAVLESSAVAATLAPSPSSPIRISDSAAVNLQAVEELRASFQKQLLMHKNEAMAANRELSELQDDLNSERQRHLATMQDMRAIQEKKIATENALRARVEDLLSELSDKRTQLDDLNDSLAAAESKTMQAEKQLEASRRKMEEMVSKEQVKEMEALFLDTVSKLSSRVQSLEVQKTSATAAVPRGASSSSSAAAAVSGSSRISYSSSVDAPGRPVGHNPSYGSAVGLAPNNSGASGSSNSSSNNKVLEPGGRLRIAPQAPIGRRNVMGEGYQADSELR